MKIGASIIVHIAAKSSRVAFERAIQLASFYKEEIKMGVLEWLIIADVYAAVCFLPVFIIWVVIPGKTVQEGFRDWINEE